MEFCSFDEFNQIRLNSWIDDIVVIQKEFCNTSRKKFIRSITDLKNIWKTSQQQQKTTAMLPNGQPMPKKMFPQSDSCPMKCCCPVCSVYATDQMADPNAVYITGGLCLLSHCVGPLTAGAGHLIYWGGSIYTMFFWEPIAKEWCGGIVCFLGRNCYSEMVWLIRFPYFFRGLATVLNFFLRLKFVVYNSRRVM